MEHSTREQRDPKSLSFELVVDQGLECDLELLEGVYSIGMLQFVKDAYKSCAVIFDRAS